MNTDNVKRLTLMIRLDDTARADIALTADRTYYRFATDSSIEDGELAAPADFGRVVADVMAASASDLDHETALPTDMKVQIFVDNRLHSAAYTEQSLRRIVEVLTDLAEEFTFLRGFVS